jgi:2-phosphosulfolactate phosphatase
VNNHFCRRLLDVALLPSFLPVEIGADQAVVIDVLRASTTIVHALDVGATAVIPCLEIVDAVRLRDDDPSLLLGGERGGESIEGFDFGNSPMEYSREAVSGHRVAFTTTNGTRALNACRSARDVVVGAFVNLSAIAEYLAAENLQKPNQQIRTQQENKGAIRLVCAGTDGRISWEDTLFAGALTALITEQEEWPRDQWELSDSARLALNAWRAIQGTDLSSQLAEGAGGQNMRRLQREPDIAWAATIDSSHRVPKFHQGEIR